MKVRSCSEPQGLKVAALVSSVLLLLLIIIGAPTPTDAQEENNDYHWEDPISFSSDEVRFPYNFAYHKSNALSTSTNENTDQPLHMSPSAIPTTFSPQPTISSRPSSVPTSHPTKIPSIPYIQSFGGSPPIDMLPLSVCQGDCDSNSDCDVGLHCFQREPGQEVPHCLGGKDDTSQTDYCVPIPDTKVVSFGGSPETPVLQKCEGDCDTDDDCVPGLFCYQRGSNEAVPGCDGGLMDASKTDYCTDVLMPTAAPFTLPTPPPGAITYHPGNLTTFKDDLLLSDGLDAKLVATSGLPVQLANGGESLQPFHGRPDGAATFKNPNGNGFIYVSNSEILSEGDGGVGALTFDAMGNVVNYKMVLQNSTWNCGGGKSPWETWISCEEFEKYGQIWQVDPLGERAAETTSFPEGRWEAFAFDVRIKSTPRFFATEDRHNGALARFTPSQPKWRRDEWTMLHGEGTMDYLLLNPYNTSTQEGGTFSWTSDRGFAKANAALYYPHTEGIDVHEGIMYVTCKQIKMLYILDLDGGTYSRISSVSGLFDGSPDQVNRIVDDPRGLLYFTEEGGKDAGVHARDHLGRFYTIFESPIHSGETTGLAFSPDGRYMLVAYQTVGKLYLVWRRDGLPFQGERLDVKYHATET